MSVIAGGSHDIKLASDVTASPTTEVELILAKDDEGNKRWRELRAQPFPPRQSQGPLQWTHKDSRVDHVKAQSDWSAGGLQLHYMEGDSNRYSQADGCDARWGPVTLGMKKVPADFLLRNGGAELGATTGWSTGSGVTLTASTSSPRSGSYVFSSVNGSGTTLFTQTLVNPTVWRSREFTVTAWIKRTVGSSYGARIKVYDAGGSPATAVQSTAVTASSYTRTTATFTPNSGATSVTIEIEATGTPSSHTFFVDDVSVTPTGGVVWAGTAQCASNLYAACGRTVLQWDETNDVWNAVSVHATQTTTDIIEFNGNVFVAFAGGASFIYGTGTSWTTSTTTDPGLEATYFAVSRGTFWKSGPTSGNNTNYSVYSNTNPVNSGASWSGAYTVGSTDRAITAMYDIGDTLIVAKEDGLFYYKRVYNDGASANEFVNITSEFASMPSSENFARGAQWQGNLYMGASLQSFFVIEGQEFSLHDLSGLFFHPEVDTMGGRPWAMAGDPAQLWLLVNTPTADTSTSKTVWLMSLRSPGDWKLHPIQTVEMGDINDLATNNGYLYAMGRLYDGTAYVNSSYRWTLPADNVAPAFASSPVINTTGTFTPPQFGFELPETQKAQLAMTFIVSDTDAEHTIAVKFGLDGAAPSTTSLGTINSASRVQTLYFNGITTPESNAISHLLQPELTFTTDDTVSPKLHAMALHSAIRPARFRVWECHVEVGDGLLLNNGNTEPVSKSSVLSKLDTLETQVYPIAFEHDIDQDGVATEIRVHVLDIGKEPEVGGGQVREGVEVWRLILQEADVS
jgi:phosphoribosyl-AMP cyclohydrolase